MGRAEADTLEILLQNGEAYQSDIMRATGFSRSTVSEVLSSLEERRMITRIKQGRNSKIALVAGGQRAKGRLRLGFTRAAEYPFLVPLRRTLRERGLELEFRVYDNGIAVARDLSLLKIDIAIAPLITLFMMHALDAPFKIIGPAGSGGSSVLASPKAGRAHRQGVSAVCTKMSTMEVLMRAAESRHEIEEVTVLNYADSPREIEGALFSGAADVCAVWEPYATMYESRGAKRILRYADLPEHVCCAAAVGNHLGERVLSRLSAGYATALDEFRRDRRSCYAAYAAISGLESSTVRRVEAEYSYPGELSGGSVVTQLEAAGLKVPSPSSFEDALYHTSA
jgi:predicted transcriptional regulator